MAGLDITVLEKVGIAGVAFGILYFGFQLFKLFMAQWKDSSDAVNKNTEAFTGLARVLEQSNEREIEFQAHVKQKLDASEVREMATLEKVNEIHRIIR